MKPPSTKKTWSLLRTTLPLLSLAAPVLAAPEALAQEAGSP